MKSYNSAKKIHDVYLFFERAFRVLHFKHLRKFVSQKKHNVVTSYLEFFNKEIIDNYKNLNKINKIVPDNEMKIWFCWLQGEDNMPELIKACYKSIIENCGKHEVVLITSDNIFDYIQLPDYIIEKFNSKKISYAQYSDIIRVNLLNNYGGIWMDSTLYCYSNLPDSIFNKKIFSGIKFRKSEIPNSTQNLFISNYYWSGFFCGTNEINNTFFSYMVDSFNHYWKDNDSLIEYLLIDYLFYVAYKNINEVKYEFDSTAYNNSHAYDMTLKKLNSCSSVENVKDKENYLYKLSRHNEYKKKINGKDTVYNDIIRGIYNA